MGFCCGERERGDAEGVRGLGLLSWDSGTRNLSPDLQELKDSNQQILLPMLAPCLLP